MPVIRRSKWLDHYSFGVWQCHAPFLYGEVELVHFVTMPIGSCNSEDTERGEVGA